MTSRISLLFVGGLLILFTGSCQPDREVVREYPLLTTEVAEITAYNAKLTGIIIGELSEITETGFVWSTSTVLDMNNGEKFIHSGSPDLERFTHITEPSLFSGTQYNARAFVRTGDLIIYGNIVSFTTLSSVKPVQTP